MTTRSYRIQATDQQIKVLSALFEDMDIDFLPDRDLMALDYGNAHFCYGADLVADLLRIALNRQGFECRLPDWLSLDQDTRDRLLHAYLSACTPVVSALDYAMVHDTLATAGLLDLFMSPAKTSASGQRQV